MASTRVPALVVTCCLAELVGCTVAKPTSHPHPAGSTSTPSRQGTIRVRATDCRRKLCPPVRDNGTWATERCNWREVTKSAKYEQADDPSFFRKVLPVAVKADTQGWHHSPNATACFDLVYQGAVGEHGGSRVGCVCSLYGLNAEHLLCSYDFKTNDFYAQPVQVNVNKSACSSLLNGTAKNFVNTTSSIRPTPAAGTKGTTINGTERPEKFENIKEFGLKLGVGLGIPTVLIILIILAYRLCALKAYRHCQQQRNQASTKSNSSCGGNLQALPHSPVTRQKLPKPRDCFANPALPLGNVSSFQHRVNDAQDAERQLNPAPDPSQEGGPTATLSKNKAFIIEHVELGNIPETLMEKKVLTKSDFEEVVTRNQERGRGRAMETLIDILCRPEHANDVACFVDLLHVPRQEKEALFGCLIKSVKGRDSFESANRLSHLKSQSCTCTAAI